MNGTAIFLISPIPNGDYALHLYCNHNPCKVFSTTTTTTTTTTSRSTQNPLVPTEMVLGYQAMCLIQFVLFALASSEILGRHSIRAQTYMIRSRQRSQEDYQ
jgi:hypothetical protein